MRRPTLFATVALAGLLSLPAVAQTQFSAMSNVPQEDRRSIGPDPLGSADHGPRQWIRQAQGELRANRLGAASELVERAETRLLSRSTLASDAYTPMGGDVVAQLGRARTALAAQDREGARVALDAALASLGSPSSDPDQAAPMMRPGKPIRY